MKTAEELMQEVRRCMLRGNRWYRRAERIARMAAARRRQQLADVLAESQSAAKKEETLLRD